jgi:hypothetical protein
MGPRCSSTETQVCHRSYNIAAKNTPKIAIFRICYGENGTVKFLETLADNVFRHNYSNNGAKKKVAVEA